MNPDNHRRPHLTRGVVTTSGGTRVRVDELDMAVLNIGHGTNPMTNAHLRQASADATGRPGNFMRPVYNVEPGLQQSSRMVQNDPMAREVSGDANRPNTIREATGISQFDQIHAVNPYAYDPMTTARDLLAPQGKMVVTGQERNPFANPITNATTVEAKIGTKQPKKVPVPRISHNEAGVDLLSSTQKGTIAPLHESLPQGTTAGREINTRHSQSHTYQRNMTGYQNVTPTQDNITRQNTAINADAGRMTPTTGTTISTASRQAHTRRTNNRVTFSDNVTIHHID